MSAPAPAGVSELLAAGDDRAPRTRRWVWLVAALAVVAALVAWADGAQRGREFEAVVDRTAQGAQLARWADGLVGSTVQYASPLLISTRVPADVRAGLGDLVSQSAGRGAADLRQARTALAETTVLPWHSALRQARDAAVAYLDARLAFLDAVAADHAALGTRRDFTATYDAAVDALRAAAPTPADAAAVAARLGDSP